MTSEIIKRFPKSLFLIEKDEKLSKELLLKYSQNKQVKVITGDVLKLDLEKNYFEEFNYFWKFTI